jgi:ketosteroid isomerase-like protein
MSQATHPPPEHPEQLGLLFAERANRGDLDGMLALYEGSATFVGPDGVSATGKENIRVRLVELLAMAPKITNADADCVIADDVALMCRRWSMRLGVLDAYAAAVDGESTEVARRQPGGGWLYVIDHPAVPAVPAVPAASEAPR